MVDIAVSGLTKYFGSDKVFEDISFEVFTGQHIAVIGNNGAGKTTLIRILSGELLPDKGTVSFPGNAKVSITSQIPVYPEGFSVEDVLQTAFDRLHDIKKQMSELEIRMSDNQDKALIKKYGELSALFESGGGYDTDVNLNKVANGLKLDENFRKKQFSVLSGGEKTRVNLARVVLEQPDILLLDEPTNHLDIESVEWLAQFVNDYKKTILIVSHDRWFLDETVDEIFELENGKLSRYSGNYSSYAVQKEEQRERAEAEYERQQKEIKRLEDAAALVYAWGSQSDKLMRRSFAIQKRIERMTVLDRPKKPKKLNVKFKAQENGTEDLIKCKNLKFEADGKKIIDGLNLEIKNGDKLAIIGKNGAGKTTLLKLLMGEIKRTDGSMFVSPSVKYAYLPQIVVFPNEQRNMIDTLIYEKNMSAQSARNRLGAFGFSGEAQTKPISVLSGGEKSRLYLCMAMADDVNMLILDEPTNHLDIASKEWIEQAIEEFDGTLIFVSHDRYFITRFANKILTINDGEGEIFAGNFNEYTANLEKQKSLHKNDVDDKNVKPKIKKETKTQNEEGHIPSKKINAKQQAKKVAALEKEITAVEKQEQQLTEQMKECATDAEKLCELSAELEEIVRRKDSLYEQWQIEAELAEI